jgi:AraC family transcriptional regulator
MVSEAEQIEDTIARVCDFICHNLEQDLNLEVLSEKAGYSKYHFHRLFAAQFGISLVEYVQLRRLKRASYRLAFHPDERIIDIALEAGFERPEAFTKAFKRIFNQTPSSFRESPCWDSWQRQYGFERLEGDTMNLQVEIIDFPTTKVAALEHHGPPTKTNETVTQFIEWRKATGLSPYDTVGTFGVPWNDPYAVPPEDFRWDVCGAVDAAVPENDYGVVTKEIPGGRCARVEHRGSRDQMDKTVYALYRDWLPTSGEKTRDYPCYFQYHNFFPEVPEVELSTSVYLPLT